MNNLRDFIINVAILTELFIILICEFKTTAEKKAEAHNRLNHKIIAVLIRHGGKMSCFGISKYLGIPSEIIRAQIAEMEKKKLIGRRGDGNQYIYLYNKH